MHPVPAAILISTSILLMGEAFAAMDDPGTDDPGFELDHFFVAVPDPGTGLSALASAGFQVTPRQEHSGQGTASHGVLFQNAYLELIWLADSAEATSAPIRRTRLAERLRPGSAACPFGLGLRRTGEAQPDFSFGVWDYSPPYLPEGMSFQMASSSEATNEPLIFYLPVISSRPKEIPFTVLRHRAAPEEAGVSTRDLLTQGGWGRGRDLPWECQTTIRGYRQSQESSH